MVQNVPVKRVEPFCDLHHFSNTKCGNYKIFLRDETRHCRPWHRSSQWWSWCRMWTCKWPGAGADSRLSYRRLLANKLDLGGVPSRIIYTFLNLSYVDNIELLLSQGRVSSPCWETCWYDVPTPEEPTLNWRVHFFSTKGIVSSEGGNTCGPKYLSCVGHPKYFWLGWYDLLEKLASVKNCQKTACRTLHRLVRATGMSLPLKLDVAEITIKRLKPLGTFKAYWPFLKMETWTSYLLTHHPGILLGGHKLSEKELWGPLFHNFWKKYKSIDPTHALFQTDYDWKTCVPYAFHGDEGRGTGRIPFLVLSYQPIISHRGMDTCNDSSYFGVIYM